MNLPWMRDAEWIERRRFCSFGITEAIGAVIASAVAGVGELGADIGGALGLTGAADAAGTAGAAAGAADAGAGLAGTGTIFSAAPATADLAVGAGGIGATEAGLGTLGADALGGIADAATDVAGAADTGATGATGAINAATGSVLPAGTAAQAAAPTAAGAGAGGAGVSAAGAAAPASVPVGGGGIVLDSGPPLSAAEGGSSLGALPGSADFGAVPGDASLSALQSNAAAGEAGLSTTSGSEALSGAAGAGGAAPASSGPSSFFSGLFGTSGSTPSAFGAAINNPTWGNIGAAVGANSGTLISAGGLGLSALEGMKEPPGYGNLESTANQLSAQGKQLSSYLNTGQLPPGVQASINQAGQDAAATIRSQYAARGMSGSSAEQQDLANVQTTMASQASSIAMQLLNEGVSEENISSQLYTELMNVAMQQDQELSSAVTNFAVAAAGGNRPTVNVYNSGA